MRPSQVISRLLRELKLCARKEEHKVLTDLLELSRVLANKKAELEKENAWLKKLLEDYDAKPTTSE